MKEIRDYTYHIFLIVILSVLLIVRCFSGLPSDILGALNFAGIPISVFGIWMELRTGNQRVRGIIFFVILVLLAVTVLMFIGVINLTQKGLDLSLLVTLIISLPGKLYIYLLLKIKK